MSTKNANKKNVVIVGGGGGGARAARLLSKSLDASQYNLILIDPRPHFILLPATARLNVTGEDGLLERATVPLKDVFNINNGTHVQHRVTSIKKSPGGGGKVTLDNNEDIPFSVLILGPGSTWNGPFAFPDSKVDLVTFLEKSRESIKNAESIVLVGSGAVGIELAGEIRDLYPTKKLTVVHGSNAPLNSTYPLKFRRVVADRLRAKNVELLFNEFVDEFPAPGSTELKTRSGRVIRTDLVLPTTGPRPITDFVASSLGADILTNSGQLKVESTLQLLGHKDIFAVGDVVGLPEQKQLAKALNHAAIVSANVLAYLTGGTLKPYKGGAEMIVVTLGKNGGVAYFDVLWGIVLGDWFARMVKSKGLMIDMLRGNVL